MRSHGSWSLVLVVLLAAASSLRSADWPTFAHDPQRSGWAFEENKLNPQNASQLELKWKVQVKNQATSIFALMAPVVATKVTTPQGVKTLVYIAGGSNNIFALDAEDGKIVWSREFVSHVLPKDEPFWLCPNNLNATPTIDRTRGGIFVLAADGKTFGLDLGTGDIKFGPVQFVPAYSKDWSLNLLDGRIYTGISQGCGGAQSGLYSMDIREPLRPSVQDQLGASGGIWGRGGPVIGMNGRVYASTGDGPNDPASGRYGSSVIAASMPDLKIVDYFTPVDWRDVNKFDLDISSASPVWFAYGNYNLLAAGGKQAFVYLLDADALGAKDHHTALFVTPRLANDQEALEQQGIWGALSTWSDRSGNTWLYVPIWGAISKDAPKFPVTNGPNPHGCFMAFKLTMDRASKEPVLEPAWISGDFKLPDPAVIANGVLLAVATGENPQQTKAAPPGTDWKKKLLTDAEKAANTTNARLLALDASTGKLLYQSGDAIGTWTHFSGLGVADGQIYAVDHDSWVYCFGLKKTD
jgi:outer membrane protein assembly factor BamB